MEKKRVVVTGMGIISPIGNTIDSFWKSVKEQKIGIKENDRFDTSQYKAKLAALVEDFEPTAYMTPKETRRMELFSQYAVAAAGQALEQAGLDLEKENAQRIGVCVGSGIGSLSAMEQAHEKILTKGPKRVQPLVVPLMISNMAGCNIAIHFGLKGKNINVVTACATGTQSIGEAFRAIQWGEADVMVAGGTEAAITPVGISGFSSLTALTSETDPARASIPFDKERSGFVMGEGAGVVVLESYEHAMERGATILAEVAGYGATCDAYHITTPSPDGEEAARAMLLAVEDAGILPEQVDYINAHATSTHYNDLYETIAIKKAFGEHAYRMSINGTKSMVGHTLGAAGAIEFIVCVKSLLDNYIHATVGLKVKDEELDLDYTPEPRTDKELHYALSNSLGFGGHNGSLLVKKFE